MNRRRFLAQAGKSGAVALVGAGTLAAQTAEPPADDPSVLTRRRLLEAVRRLSAEGWRPRDATWTALLSPGQARALPAHWIAGNSYLVVCVVRPTLTRLHTQILDPAGQPLVADTQLDEPGLTALVVIPAVTGRYQLRVSLPADISADASVAAAYLFK